jgi:hypothetical protein
MAVVATFDADRLSSFLDIDVPDLQTVLDTASGGVAFILKQVQLKAAEFEQLANEKELLQVDYGGSPGGELTFRARSSYHECQGNEYERAASESN